MDLEQFEDDITARLTLTFQGTGVVVAPFPNVQADFKDGIENPLIWIAFKESKFAQPYEQDPRYFATIGATSQDATLYFEVFYKTRKRRGPNGLFDLRNKVLNSLNGWNTPSADKMFPVTDTSLELRETVWFWSSIFGVKFISVPEVNEDDWPDGLTGNEDPLATMQKGTYLNEDVGDLVVENPQ